MIKRFVTDVSAQMKVHLSKITIVDGRKLGCIDMNLLHLTANDDLVSVLVSQSQLNELKNSSYCYQLDHKIRSALSRLQSLQNAKMKLDYGK
jgi:hypothetical protein